MSVYLSTFISGAIEVPVNVVAIFVVDRRPFGRRVSGCVSFVVAGVACFLCAVAALLGKPLWTRTFQNNYSQPAIIIITRWKVL